LPQRGSAMKKLARTTARVVNKSVDDIVDTLVDPRKLLRKKAVMARYDLSERLVDLYSNDGRLPKPIFPFPTETGKRPTPYWRVEDLIEHDKKTGVSS
jgi:hypothetical protein